MPRPVPRNACRSILCSEGRARKLSRQPHLLHTISNGRTILSAQGGGERRLVSAPRWNPRASSDGALRSSSAADSPASPANGSLLLGLRPP